jgi:excisionase family DNA binding protein
MRPPRTSPANFPRFETTDQKSVTSPADDATLRVIGEAQAGSKSAPSLPPSELPAWVHRAAAKRSRTGNKTKDEIDVPDYDGGKVRGGDGALLNGRQALSNRSEAIRRAIRLDPLLTVAETAMILNVSGRTVRRLITSGAIPALSIGRSLRLRPRDIGGLIANGGNCND